MDILGAIGSIFTSGGFGAAIGLVGSWLTKREERENLKLQFDHDYKMAVVRKDEMQAEQAHELAVADKQIKRTEIEGAINQNLKEADAFIESQKSGNEGGWKGLVRPVITIYLLGVSTWIGYSAYTLMGGMGVLPKESAFELYQKIIAEVLFLTSTAVTWWYGARPAQKLK